MRHGLVILAVWGLADAVAAGAIWAQVHPPQQVRFVGRVYDEARRPIDRAEVIVNRRAVRATTDGFGVFHLDLAPGDSTVGFRRIGYRPLLLSVNPLPPPDDTILVELVSNPVELAEVIVTGSPSKPLRYAGTTKYDDVFERRKIGLGTLIPRQAIDRRPGGQTYQLLEGLAGVHVYGDPVRQIRFARCPPEGVTVWIDGVRQISYGTGSTGARLTPSSNAPGAGGGGSSEDRVVEMLSRINAAEIEMIEVFRGPSEIPGVFAWEGCAVIAIWTKWNK